MTIKGGESLGLYDQLIYRKKVVQVKCFDCVLDTLRPGDLVYDKWLRLYGNSFTVVLPNYEPAKYAVFIDGEFEFLTNSVKRTFAPYISKWGEKLPGPELVNNPFETAIKEVIKRKDN